MTDATLTERVRGAITDRKGALFIIVGFALLLSHHVIAAPDS